MLLALTGRVLRICRILGAGSGFSLGQCSTIVIFVWGIEGLCRRYAGGVSKFIENNTNRAFVVG